jgi:serine/threonine protein kinase
VTWQHLNHPNILPLIGAKMVDEKDKRVYEIVSDLMENGDIMKFTKKNAGVDRLKLVSFLLATILLYSAAAPSLQLQDVAAGLSYLHSQSVVHGDIKGVRVSAPIDLSFFVH